MKVICLKTLRAGMLISSFQILTCCSCALMRTKLMKKLNRNPTEEEDSTKCLEISS